MVGSEFTIAPPNGGDPLAKNSLELRIYKYSNEYILVKYYVYL